MGKYEPLRRYLESQTADSVNANFSQLEEILGFRLPQSAYRYQAWWANESHGSHSHSRSWQDAGWDTSLVNTSRGTVTFQRRRSAGNAGTEAPAASQGVSQPNLWDHASRLSGIEDREKLIEAALLALIQREAGRALMQMGGTMPDLVVPERERPFA